MKNIVRSALCTAFAALALGGAASTAQAQANYPTRPISMVVGFSAGGSADILARLLAQKMSTALGQQIIIDNRPGAGATIATLNVLGQPADGYTLLFVTSGHAGSTALYPKLKYDTVTSFASIGKVGASPVVIVAPAGSPLKTLLDVLAAARKAPGKINYAAGGGGATTTSLAAEFLKNAAQVDMQQIPYKGSGPALTALLGNEVDIGFDIPSSSLPFIQSGRLVALAVTSKTRSAVMPNVPTIAESAVPNFEVTGWFGLLARAGTPPEVVARLNKELNAALALPDVKERFASLAVEIGGGTPADFTRLIQQDTRRYAEAIKRMGITAE